MLRALTLAGMLVAGAAHAVVLVPECYPTGAERDAGIGPYTAGWWGNGFVYYASDFHGVFTFTLLLDDCHGKRRLEMTVPERSTPSETIAAENALGSAVQEAVQSDKAYTMAQIRDIARAAGARANLGPMSYESCACKNHANAD